RPAVMDIIRAIHTKSYRPRVFTFSFPKCLRIQPFAALYTSFTISCRSAVEAVVNHRLKILAEHVLPGGVKGTRTPDPLLAKLGQDVQHCRWRGTMRSQVSSPVRQCPSALVSVVGVMPGLTSLII